jgi:putative ABC transport system permease protein
MSPVLYKKLMGNEADPNSFYGLLNNATQGYQDETARALKSIRNVNSVAFRNNIQIDYGESMESVSFVVLILIVSAGVLAFVVIYNLTNINIAERKRELATIKLLGFYNIELAAYIYRENTILTMIGTGSGVLLGKIMNGYILLSAETNSIMFLNEISFIYFMYSILLTIGFSMIVNLAMYPGFSRIDMIESLKSVE